MENPSSVSFTTPSSNSRSRHLRPFERAAEGSFFGNPRDETKKRVVPNKRSAQQNYSASLRPLMRSLIDHLSEERHYLVLNL